MFAMATASKRRAIIRDTQASRRIWGVICLSPRSKLGK
jgi:hypothetical protein